MDKQEKVKCICEKCAFAVWDKTGSGRLSHYGGGRCTYVYIPAPLPASMYLLGGATPSGGYINRRGSKFSGPITECPTFKAQAL